jgi:hypothetical protein
MRMSPRSLLIMAAGVLALSACLHAGRGQDRVQVEPRPGAGPARQQLVAAKARLMAADYHADLARLALLRDQVAPLGGDPEVGYLAHYWTGFASWRLAINGASHGMSRDDLKGNLEQAVRELEAAIRLRDDFADAHAAAAGVNSWLLVFLQNDQAAFREHLASMTRQLARARELAPNNPRLLWVDGGILAFKPAAYGGDVQAGMQVYRRAVEVAAAPEPSSPLPDWGKPEALMSLAYFHLNQAVPDLAAATEEAHAALRLQPEWSYVRDVLLPMIEARRKQLASPSPDSKPAQPPPAVPPSTRPRFSDRFPIEAPAGQAGWRAALRECQPQDAPGPPGPCAGADPRAQAAARPRSSSRSRALRVSEAARSSSARASSRRPSLARRSPRTLGNRW